MRIIFIFFMFTIGSYGTQAQSVIENITEDDINTTCYVISELMDMATKNGDKESILIFSNTFDKIKKTYLVDESYIKYFDSIKATNVNILEQGIIISLNESPKPIGGFKNHEVIGGSKILKNKIDVRKNEMSKQ